MGCRLSPLGLLLQGSEAAKIALGIGDFDYRVGANSAQQLVFQITIAGEKAVSLQLDTGQSQGGRSDCFLGFVIEPSIRVGSESGEIGDASRHHRYHVQTKTICDDLDCSRITRTLDKHLYGASP